MKTVCKKNMCNTCMICITLCPQKCITLDEKIDKSNMIINEDECINCGLCKRLCPRNSPILKSKPFNWKQGWAEARLRDNSSSGGIASTIMNKFIEDGGYVASCIFEDGNFTYKMTNDKSMIAQFAGSKYVKSNPSSVYISIKNKLKTNKVLFVGLPCQVAALKNYIPNNDNLFTIDILCHGAPSTISLNAFLDEYKIQSKHLTNIKFRIDKYSKPLSKTMDNYSIAFLHSLIATENCFSCDYTTEDRVSDITLGDSWGSELSNELKNGLSLILIQSKKGNELIKRADISLHEVNSFKAINKNQPLREPIRKSKAREVFLKNYYSGKGFNRSVFCAVPIACLKQSIKKILFWTHLFKEDKYRISIFEKVDK